MTGLPTATGEVAHGADGHVEIDNRSADNECR